VFVPQDTVAILLILEEDRGLDFLLLFVVAPKPVDELLCGGVVHVPVTYIIQ
jgi:hypothetical protein